MILSAPSILVVSAGALFAVGLFCLMAKSHLIKMVMGLEFLGKSASLLFIVTGYLSGDTGLSQAVVFTLIAIEAVVAGVALALAIRIRKGYAIFDIPGTPHLPREGDP